MRKNINYTKKLNGFTLMEMLITLIISSIMFIGMSIIFVENIKVHTYEDVKNDSKVFANYVLDHIENSLSVGTEVSVQEGIGSDIDEITVSLSGGDLLIYSSHSEYGIAENQDKIFNFDNKYDNGELKYSITAFNCYKPETDQYFPANPASNSILTSSFKLELIISIYNPSNIKLEEYTVNRYVFNPYIYTENA